MQPLPYIIVIGGSYVGVKTAQELATVYHEQFRILLVEKNSHFQHLFAFPRFAVTDDVNTHKAFIPFSPGTFADCPQGSGSVVQAKITSLGASSVELDRQVLLDGQTTDTIPYSYLVIATGTKLTAPSTLPGSEKLDGVEYLRRHVSQVRKSSKIAIIGGGAVGVQMAIDIKELYPEKSVTLIHSRPTVMNRFHTDLSNLILNECKTLGIETKLGSRVKLPTTGYPVDGSVFDVELQDGNKVSADLAIICTGQTPQSGLIETLSPQSIDDGKFIRVKKTLQLDDERYPSIFAVGDVAATGANKAARPGFKQAALVAQNIQHLLQGESLDSYDSTDPAAIHLTLGIIKSVVFRNPEVGSTEPTIKHKDDGRLDMGIDGVWTRRGGGIDANL